MSDFKKGFVKHFKEEEAKEKEQKALKKKHKVKDDNVVVVEKKYIHYLIMFFKSILSLIIFVLATIGLITILYKEPREIVIRIIGEAFSINIP